MTTPPASCPATEQQPEPQHPERADRPDARGDVGDAQHAPGVQPERRGPRRARAVAGAGGDRERRHQQRHPGGEVHRGGQQPLAGGPLHPAVERLLGRGHRPADRGRDQQPEQHAAADRGLPAVPEPQDRHRDDRDRGAGDPPRRQRLRAARAEPDPVHHQPADRLAGDHPDGERGHPDQRHGHRGEDDERAAGQPAAGRSTRAAGRGWPWPPPAAVAAPRPPPPAARPARSRTRPARPRTGSRPARPAPR